MKLGYIMIYLINANDQIIHLSKKYTGDHIAMKTTLNKNTTVTKIKIFLHDAELFSIILEKK